MVWKRFFSVLVAISVLTSVGRAETVPFEVHLQVNEKVETFINILTAGLLPVFSQSEVRLRRNGNGQVVDEFGHGEINAHFYGMVDAQQAEQASEFQMGATVAINPSLELNNQYKIQLSLGGEISNPKNYLKALKEHPTCSLASAPSILCQVALKMDMNADFYPTLASALHGIKAEMLSKVSEIDDRKFGEFPIIREEFLSYLDSRIVIAESEAGLSLQIDLADLASRFRGKAGSWLNENNLIDYSIESVSLDFRGQLLEVEVHLAKYHVISAFNAIMQGVASYQKSFEDPEVARSTVKDVQGQSLSALKSSLTSNAHTLESLKASASYAKARTLGSKNVGVAPSQTEQDLGLE